MFTETIPAGPPITEIPGGACTLRFPKGIVYDALPLALICREPRSVLRPTPRGRSLKIKSPLSSEPVLIVYGGAELMFPLMLSAVKFGRLSLELLVSLCSEAPARIFGFDRKGRIAPGMDADLVLFSEGELTKVDASTLLSGAGWSPYADREAAPKPELVLVDGQVVARKGRIVGTDPTGRFIGHEPAGVS